MTTLITVDLTNKDELNSLRTLTPPVHTDFVKQQLERNRTFVAFEKETGDILMVIENGKPQFASINKIKIESIYEHELK